MSITKAILFGRFRVERNGKPLEGIEANKVKELLAYLLVHQSTHHFREVLSEILWENQPPIKSKKYLRQTLWRLKNCLCKDDNQDVSCLNVEPHWVKLTPNSNWWIDVAEFNRLFTDINCKRVEEIDQEDYRKLKSAIQLYSGDLLEGWYQEWCIVERERFEAMYLILLNKLIRYCEMHQLFDDGILYGQSLLCHDRLSESAHRQVMRMYYKAGDRTRALRQFEQCARAIWEELGIEPSEPTLRLYKCILGDALDPSNPPALMEMPPREQLVLEKRITLLKNISDTITSLQSQIQKEILAIQNTL